MKTLEAQEIESVCGGSDPTHIDGPITWAWPFDPPWKPETPKLPAGSSIED